MDTKGAWDRSSADWRKSQDCDDDFEVAISLTLKTSHRDYELIVLLKSTRACMAHYLPCARDLHFDSCRTGNAGYVRMLAFMWFLDTSISTE